MAHYGMLRDYSFAEDIDDIRGADLYAADGKIGTVKDAVFDHETGDIRYLVADVGHDRRVLIDSAHVFRATADEDSFETDLPAAELARLPRFDEKALESEHEWERHHGENRKVWQEREDRYRDEYKRNWEEDPVMHMKGSERTIAPDLGPASGGEQRVISGADLTPKRISDKFAQAGPMTVPSTNQGRDDLTLRPSGTASHAESAAWGTWTRSERLRRFQNSMRNQMPRIRETCGVCCGRTRRVA
jgi:PRC-barrel domain